MTGRAESDVPAWTRLESSVDKEGGCGEREWAMSDCLVSSVAPLLFARPWFVRHVAADG